MEPLEIYIEIKGEQVHVGTIKGKSPSEASFSYLEDYVTSPEGEPISISLPLRKRAFSPKATANFFSGLLPEGFMGRRVSELAHAGANDYITVLSDLGIECLGAIKIIQKGQDELEPGYIPLKDEEVRRLAGEGVVEASELVMKSHLSLTGASGKVGLYMDPDEKKWYLPVGDAPSTHIVKQSHIRLDGIVANEHLCLKTAGKLGIEVPHNFIIDTGKAKDGEVLLATRRFDRDLDGSENELSGHRKPLRLHQEDFAQAMGLSAADKYEDQGEHYLRDLFKLIRDRARDPLSDQLRLWDIIVFDYLAGNTDDHIKNLSFLYSDDLASADLAPAYDILSTSIYESGSDSMAFNIGGDIELYNITRDSFGRAAEEAGIRKNMALKRFDRMAKGFTKALMESADELSELGFTNAFDIRDRILSSGGISRV